MRVALAQDTGTAAEPGDDVPTRPADPLDKPVPAGKSRAAALLRVLPDPVAAALTGLIAVLMYLPVVFATYGLSDDYYDLVMSARDNGTLPDLAISGGRPVSGLIQEFALSLADTPANLRWLRLIGILGLVAVALVAATVLRALGGGRWAQLAAALCVVSMPSSQVIASWAVLFTVGWGTAAALASGFSVRWLNSDRVDAVWVSTASALAAVTVIGLANYQPSAVAFAPGLAAALIDHRASIRRLAYRAAAGASGAVAGAIIYLVGSRLLMQWRGVTGDSRGELELPGWSKLSWFASTTLPRSLDTVSFGPRPLVAIGVTAFIVGGLLTLPGGWGRRLLAVGLGLIATLAAYAPTLIVVDRWPSARSRVSVDVTIALFAAIAGWSIGRRLAAPRLRAAWRAGAAVFVAGLVVFASWRVTAYYAIPQQTEWRLVTTALGAREFAPDRPLVVIAPSWTDRIAPAWDLDEFGHLSMFPDWGVVGLIQIEMINNGRPVPGDIRIIREGEPLPDGEFELLDLAGLYPTPSGR